jgi:hypothetical protein
MKKIRVIVEVSEGVATVYTDDPERLDVVIVDYDTDVRHRRGRRTGLARTGGRRRAGACTPVL